MLNVPTGVAIADVYNRWLEDRKKAGPAVVAAAPVQDPPEGDPFGEQDSKDEPCSDIAVWAMGETLEVLEKVQAFIKSRDDHLPWTPDALLKVRDTALRMLARQDAPAEFKYDCIPTRVTDAGERLDVYVVRGDAAALDRFNWAIQAVGGELAVMGSAGVEALAYSHGVLDKAEREDAFHAVLAEPLEEADPAERRHSPSVLRQRLRQQYGVRRSQLIGYGCSPECASYVSDHVAHKLRQGADIVQAIEDSAFEWLVKIEDWENVDLFNKRIDAGMSIPRLIRDGWHRDKAHFVVGVANLFIVAGVPVLTAAGWVEELWNAQEQGPEEFRLKEASLASSLQQSNQVFAMERLVVSGRERLSGAQWVARVAADLCNERNPAKNRRYRLSEAMEQAFSEWVSMTREARLQGRDEFYRGAGKIGYCLEAADDEDAFASRWIADYLGKDGGVVHDDVVQLAVKIAQGGSSLQEAAEAARSPHGYVQQASRTVPPALVALLAVLAATGAMDDVLSALSAEDGV